VAIHGPRKARAGRPVRLQAHGYAGRGARTLVVWLDDKRCAPTDRAEELRGPRLPPPGQFRVNGSFVVHLTVKRSVPGTHYACAYLTRHRTGRTVARASWRYVTRRR
jgi:hypothetical protein